MFTASVIRVFIAALLFWIGVYLVSRNIKSKLAWVLFLFLLSLSWYLVFVDVIPPLYATDFHTSMFLIRLTDWTYILPIPLILHLSVLTTKRTLKVNRYSLWGIYAISVLLILIGITTELVTSRSVIVHYDPVYGYFPAKGSLFPIIAVISIWASILAAWNYLSALITDQSNLNKIKFGLAAIGAVLYAVIGPFLVYIYSSTTLYDFAINSTAPLLIAPVAFWIISIFFFRLVSDVEEIFNLKEFVYQSGAISLLIFTYSIVLYLFAGRLRESFIFVTSILIYLVILTHGFYDWLTTFIRNLLYSAGNGFSLITDADVSDLVKNFHSPEKLETNSLLKFRSVKQKAEKGKLVDSAQDFTSEAIEYLKQSDFPRRTKQNLKYQLLKMLTQDSSEEGQILWELGFDGYPMKILSGEDNTRKPLFKIESMSDYTATSRNAFIALKKEALHDLAWRLSYLEKNTH